MEKHAIRFILNSYITRPNVCRKFNIGLSFRNLHFSCSSCRYKKCSAAINIHHHLQIRNFHITVPYAENNVIPVIIPSSKYQTRSDEKIQKISKAMRSYMQQAKEHDAFMKEQNEEFEMGKRHLANMMGVDPDHITQEDIDEAIAYLMPSGLFEPRARPVMKHPKVLFPKRKAAEFDMSGRPFHFLFYTGKPCYYQVLHDVALKIESLDAFEDKMISQGILHPPSEMTLILTGSEWITAVEFGKRNLEDINENEYKYLITSMTRLVEHPYSYREKDFIMSLRNVRTVGISDIPIPPLLTSETGQQYSTAKGKRKKCEANVTLRANGTGKVRINGQEIKYFKNMQDREQLLFPLQFTGLVNKVDLEADVTGDGNSAQAGAIRYALSLSLLSFVDKEMVEKMRIAGLLTKDPRYRERKKPGREGARRRYTWRKR